MAVTVDNLAMAQSTALGVAILYPEHAAIIFAGSRVEDFDPPYVEVAQAIHGLRLNRIPIDQLAVVDEMTRRGTLGKVGGSAFVFELVNFGYGGPTAAEYAVQVITTHARRRRLWKAGAQLVQAAAADEADPLRLAQAIVAEAQGVIDSVDAEGDIHTPLLGDFLTTQDDPEDWVIPDFLERGDRLVLTGVEGGGKSVLLRQIAAMTAAGLHPFTAHEITPQRVLYVDLENGVPKLRRAFRGLAAQVGRYGVSAAQRLWVEARPSGLDLARVEDETWLVRHVAGLQPDLLVIGPAYRLHVDNPNDEAVVRCVARVLDRCRTASNCALILEAHAGHGMDGAKRQVRPTGSSLWLRWPEFGYGLRQVDDYDPAHRVMDLVSWRGDREERPSWPKQLTAGGAFPWRDSIAGHAPPGIDRPMWTVGA